MKINHVIIREVLKWTAFGLFAISVFKKLKAIVKYGGTKPITDPNDEIEKTEDGPVEAYEEETISEVEEKY